MRKLDRIVLQAKRRGSIDSVRVIRGPYVELEYASAKGPKKYYFSKNNIPSGWGEPTGNEFEFYFWIISRGGFRTFHYAKDMDDLKSALVELGYTAIEEFSTSVLEESFREALNTL